MNVQQQSSPKSFSDIIQEWNNLDKKIEQYNQTIKKLKEKKDKLETFILSKMDDKKVTYFKFHNLHYSIGNDNNYTNLSYKYLKEKLATLFKSETKADKVIDFLKDGRVIKQNRILKYGENKPRTRSTKSKKSKKNQ